MKKSYIRELALEYAYKWALKRNPKYYNYDNLGGDCTNFISQCIFAGSKVMNYTKTFGWYYNNANDKSPSWSGVEFLYKFLTTNNGFGPRGTEVSQNGIEVGDIVQLSFNGLTFEHSLFIINITGSSLNDIAVAAHNYDVLGKKVGEYNFSKYRFVHIKNVGI